MSSLSAGACRLMCICRSSLVRGNASLRRRVCKFSLSRMISRRASRSPVEYGFSSSPPMCWDAVDPLRVPFIRLICFSMIEDEGTGWEAVGYISSLTLYHIMRQSKGLSAMSFYEFWSSDFSIYICIGEEVEWYWKKITKRGDLFLYMNDIKRRLEARK